MAIPTATATRAAGKPKEWDAPPVPVVLGEGEPELAGAVDDGAPVVPKPEVDGAGLVEMGFPDGGTLPALPEVDADLLALADLVVDRVLPEMVVDCVADTAPMEKSALVANTALMLEISTKVMV